MARYIDADKIIFHEIDEIGGEYEPYLGCSKKQIDDIKTADVQPVIHAKWMNKQHFVGCSGNAECSACHKFTSVNPHDNGFSLEYIFPKYCPNCGADMKEVEE